MISINGPSETTNDQRYPRNIVGSLAHFFRICLLCPGIPADVTPTLLDSSLLSIDIRLCLNFAPSSHSFALLHSILLR